MCNQHARQWGSALIEVLIAAVVVAFALIALVHFQASLIENSSHAKVRALALSVAQAKLDDLHSFSQLPAGGAGTFGYSEIGNGLGGREDNTGALLIPSGERTEANVEYTLTWVADDMFNCGNGSQALVMNLADCPVMPAPAPRPISDVKVVRINVSWAELLASDDPATTDVDEQVRTVTLDGVIHADDPALGALAFLGLSREKPEIRYNPGTIPDVIPVMIGPDLTQESSKPTPDTTQHEISTETQFDAVQYRTSTQEILSRRDFVTVNCVCVQDGTGMAKTPARPPLPSGSRVTLEKGEGVSVTKRRGRMQTGGQLNEQPFICNTCCRDHHDISSAATKYDPFRPVDATNYPAALGGDHSHYNRNNAGTLIVANAAGAEYIEACRFQRINGELQVAQDWRLENLITLPNSFLATNTSDYTNYVEQFVEDYVNGIGAGYPGTAPVPTTVLTNAPADITLTTTGQAQLQARGIYIDWMTSSEITALKQLLADNKPILALTPFFEVNLTRLANWSVGNTSLLAITNEPITQGSESTYNRGRVSAKGMAGTSLARAVIERSNTGLTDSAVIDPHDATLIQDDLTVVVTGSTPPPTGGTVTGSISIAGGINDVNPSTIVVTGSNGAACTKPTDSTYSCSVTGGVGTVTFSNYRGTDPDPTKWHHLCPMDTFNYSGVTMPVMQNVNLKKYNQSC